MTIILIMLVGVFLGYKFFPVKWLKINANIQLICICILIFCMGVTLGLRENFISELASLGIKSLVFSILPIIFSVIFVYFLTEKFLKKGDNNGTTRDN